MLCLELALIGQPTLVAVDDVDVALTTEEQAALWSRLREVADAGTAVVAVCRESPSLSDETIRLPGRVLELLTP
jgi:hypothetical protein